MICEGYNAQYKRKYGFCDRTLELKNKDLVELDSIAEILNDEFAASSFLFYQKWKRQGYPYAGGWAEIPAKLVEIIDLLEPLDQLYHPDQRMF